ncbi:MAG: TerB family tellurite resistance protein [Spirochaetia bacterium]|nr:TerB family tellurite resistance protein [Spirochaetia bacterium]
MNSELTNTLPFKLGQLMIAIGWIDGNLDQEEINSMKHMLFCLKGLSLDDWAKLEILMENQTDKKDLEQLIKNVLDAITNSAEKIFVLDNIRELIKADDKIAANEQALYNEIEKAVNEKNTGLFGLLSGLGKGILKRSKAIVRESLQNEELIEEYMQNKILFDIKNKFPDYDKNSLSQKDLKKWSSGAGLLGRVAIADNVFDDDEKSAIISIIESNWAIGHEMACIIGELVKKRIEDGQKNIHKLLHFDYLARSFFEETDYPERANFIKLLFQVANAAQKTSFEEIEVIRGISMDLKVSHKDYIEAKLTISRNDRSGM